MPIYSNFFTREIHQGQCLDCKNQEPPKKEKFSILRLPLAVSQGSLGSLEDKIYQYFKTEVMNDIECDSCNDGSKKVHKKQITRQFENPPKYLIILIKRYTNGFDEEGNYKLIFLDWAIKFERYTMRIDNERFIDMPTDTRTNYTLNGYIVHEPNISEDGGHYKCLCLHKGDNLWYEYNDGEFQKISTMSRQRVKAHESGATLFIYERND